MGDHDSQKPTELKQLNMSDNEFIRVLEDLIDLLISNGTIRMTDLPPKALEKLAARKKARKALNNKTLDLFASDDLESDEDAII